MGDQIVTREAIAQRARAAFAAGQDLSDNPFPWHSAAYQTWDEEWLRLAYRDQPSERAHHAQLASMPIVAAQAVDLAQGGD